MNFSRLLFTFFFAFLSFFSFSQSISFINPADFAVCNEAAFQVVITNNTGANLENMTVTLDFPCDIEYVANTIAGGTEEDISDLNQPVFNLADLAIGSFVILNFDGYAPCAVSACVDAGQLFTYSLDLDYSGGQLHNVSSTQFDMETSLLVFTKVEGPVMHGVKGQVLTRKLTLRNTRPGPVSNFTFTDVHDLGLIISSDVGTDVSVGSGELKLVFGPADFMSVGDGDGLLEQGEDLVITESILIDVCGQEQIAALSDISVGWGCGGETCSDFDVNAIVYVELNTDLGGVLTFDSIVTDPTCYCGTELLPQGLVITNTSIRHDVSNVEIQFPVLPEGTYFYGANVQLVQGGSTTELATTFQGEETQPCLPNADTYSRMSFTIPTIPLGTQVTVLWDMTVCKKEACQHSGISWSFLGAYYKDCTLPDDTYHEIDIHSIKPNNNMSASLESKFLVNNQSQILKYHVSSVYLDELAGQLNLAFDLPCGMSIEEPVDWGFAGVDPTDVDISMVDKVTHVALSYPTPMPDSVGFVAIPVLFTLDPDCYGTELPPKDSLLTTCSHVCIGQAACSSVSNGASIDATAELVFDPFCNPECTLQYCNSNGTTFGGATSGVCLDTVPGYASYTFDLYRTTLGQADNDDNHVADVSGNIDLSAIRRDRAVAGDTVRAEVNAVIVTDFANVSFSNAYLELLVSIDSSFGVQNDLKGIEIKKLLSPNSGFDNFSKTLKIFDKSAGVYYSCPLVPDGYPAIQSGQTLLYYYDISPASLSMAGGSVPVDYVYEKGDSILFTADYLVNYNFKNGSSFGFFSLLFAPKLFLSEVSFPERDELFACNCKEQNLEIANIAHFSQEGFASTIEICNGETADGGFLFPFFYGVFPNFFPNEYRQTAMLKEIKVPRVEGLELKEVFIEFATLNGHFILDYPDSTVVNYSSIEIANEVYPNEDVTGFYVFKLSDFPDLFWDDNVYVRLRLNYKNTGCRFEGSHNYKGLFVSDLLPQNDDFHIVLDTVTRFRLTGKRPSLNIDFELCDKLELSDSISWDLSISNLLNQLCPHAVVTDAPNLWLRPIVDNGLVDNYKLYNRTTGVELLAQNGIFQLDSLHQCDTIDLHLTATNHDCSPVDVRFEYGWSCTPYVDPINTPCISQEAICQVTSPPGVIDLLPDSLDLSASLCEEMPWSYVEVFDAGLGSVFDLAVEAQLPPGLIVNLGSSEMEWPSGSGDFVSVNDPVDLGSGLYKWLVTNEIDTLSAHGLPGVNFDPSNSVTIRFRTLTDCDFISGSFIIYSATAKKICDLPTNTIAKIGGQMNVSSIVAPYSTAITIGSDGHPGCEDSLTVVVNLSFSDTTDSFDALFAQLPSGVTYVPNSCNSSLPSSEPTISGNELQWDFPQGILDATLSFKVVGFLGYDCKSLAIPFYATSQMTAACTGMAQDCDIKVQTGAQVATIKIEKPIFSINSFTAHPLAGNVDLVDLQIDMTNVGILNTAPIVLKIYLDNDGDGLVSAGDDLVQTFSFEKYLEEDEQDVLTIFAHAISPDDICKLMVVIDEQENCVCANTIVKVQTPIFYPSVVVDTICSGAMVVIGRPDNPEHQFHWDGPSGMCCTSFAKTSFMKKNETSNAITYHLILREDGDCLLEYEYIITVLPELVIWSADEQVCLGDIATLVAADGATYQWQGEGITDPALQIQMVSPMSTTTYSVTMSNELGCTKVDHATVEVLAIPIADAGDDILVCHGQEVFLNAIVEAGNSVTWIPGSPKLDDSSIPNPKVLTEENTTFTLNVTNAACSATDEVKVSFFDGVVLTISPDQAVCLGDTVTIEVSGAETYVWTPMITGMCQDVACAKIKFVPTMDIHLTVKGTATDGCEATAEVNVLIIEDTLLTSSSIDICNGSSVVLFGEEVNTAGTYCDTIERAAGCYEIKCVTVSVLDSIFVEADIDICEGESYSLDGQLLTESGIYCVSGVSVGGCDSTYCVNLSVLLDPSLDITPNEAFIQIGDSVQLTVTDGLVDYVWTPSEFLSCADCVEPNAFPTSTTWFYVDAQDVNGCHNMDSVLVHVETLCEVEVKVPNAFTPNGDGKNDFFRIANLSSNLGDVDITIYSRWGKKVFSGSSNSGWDGKFKGKELPSDVYVYLIKMDCVVGEKRLLKGQVTLLR